MEKPLNIHGIGAYRDRSVTGPLPEAPIGQPLRVARGGLAGLEGTIVEARAPSGVLVGSKSLAPGVFVIVVSNQVETV
jgi:hypothetical protein